MLNMAIFGCALQRSATSAPLTGQRGPVCTVLSIPNSARFKPTTAEGAYDSGNLYLASCSVRTARQSADRDPGVFTLCVKLRSPLSYSEQAVNYFAI